MPPNIAQSFLGGFESGTRIREGFRSRKQATENKQAEAAGVQALNELIPKIMQHGFQGGNDQDLQDLLQGVTQILLQMPQGKARDDMAAMLNGDKQKGVPGLLEMSLDARAMVQAKTRIGEDIEATRTQAPEAGIRIPGQESDPDSLLEPGSQPVQPPRFNAQEQAQRRSSFASLRGETAAQQLVPSTGPQIEAQTDLARARAEKARAGDPVGDIAAEALRRQLEDQDRVTKAGADRGIDLPKRPQARVSRITRGGVTVKFPESQEEINARIRSETRARESAKTVPAADVKQLLASGDILSASKKLLDNLDPKFFGVKKEATAGIRSVADAKGGLIEQFLSAGLGLIGEKEMTPKEKVFRAELTNLLNASVKALSGVAVRPDEREEMRKVLGKMTDRPELFRATMQAFAERSSSRAALFTRLQNASREEAVEIAAEIADTRETAEEIISLFEEAASGGDSRAQSLRKRVAELRAKKVKKGR